MRRGIPTVLFIVIRMEMVQVVQGVVWVVWYEVLMVGGRSNYDLTRPIPTIRYPKGDQCLGTDPMMVVLVLRVGPRM